MRFLPCNSKGLAWLYLIFSIPDKVLLKEYLKFLIQLDKHGLLRHSI